LLLTFITTFQSPVTVNGGGSLLSTYILYESIQLR
jgi:hypothetical protein